MLLLFIFLNFLNLNVKTPILVLFFEKVCNTQSYQVIFSKTKKLANKECWTHSQQHHDIFLNYRVSCEGKQSHNSSVCIFIDIIHSNAVVRGGVSLTIIFLYL